MSNSVSAETNGAATASLVCGIFGLLGFGLLTGIPAVICGHVALSRIRASRGTIQGHGLAVAGLVCGYISVVATVALALLVMPTVSHARLQTRLESLAMNGRAIQRSVVAYNHDGVFTGRRDSGFPSSARYRNSTDYFGMLVSSNIMSVPYSFFEVAGARKAPGGAAGVRAEHNAWSVVADLEAEPPEPIPFLLSRNIRAENLSDLKGRVADTLSDAPPFGRRAAVFVTAGCSVFILEGPELNRDWDYFLFLGEQDLTNRVLRP